MIRLEDVSLGIGNFALEGVTIDVPSGGYGLIIGPTGSGKTTLLEAVAGHVPIRGGRITLDGRDVTRLAPEARGIGFVYQSYPCCANPSFSRPIPWLLIHQLPACQATFLVGTICVTWPSDERRT